MMLDNGDRTITAGPLDVICILQDEDTERYHVAFFEEYMFPGEIAPVEEVTCVRLKSKMHHTPGVATIEEAQVELAKLREGITIDDANVSDKPILWNGVIGHIWIYPNWKRLGQTFSDMLT